MMYYTSPHSVTGKTPTELCFGRTIRSKIPSLQDIESAVPTDEVTDRDQISKQLGKEKEDKRRHAKCSDMQAGDTVLMKNLLPGNKLTTTFGTDEYVVISKKGATVMIRDKKTNKVYQRNVAHLKRVADESRLPVDDSPYSGSDRPQLDDQGPSPIVTESPSKSLMVSENSRPRREVTFPSRFKDFVVGD